MSTDNQNQVPPGLHRKVTDISEADAASVITHVGEPIIDLLNQYGQKHGATLALYGGLYAMGCALACIGAALDERTDLRVQLSPLLEGYENQLKAMAH